MDKFIEDVELAQQQGQVLQQAQAKRNKPGAGRPKLPPGVSGKKHNVEPDQKTIKALAKLEQRAIKLKLKDYEKCLKLEAQLESELKAIQEHLRAYENDPALASSLTKSA